MLLCSVHRITQQDYAVCTQHASVRGGPGEVSSVPLGPEYAQVRV